MTNHLDIMIQLTSIPHHRGMVVTVEPGLYIEEEGIGIRIEDNILIQKMEELTSKDIIKRLMILKIMQKTINLSKITNDSSGSHFNIRYVC